MKQRNFQKFCQNHWTLVGIYGVEVGRAREGVRPPANGKQGNRFSTWVQSGIRTLH
jgi:hypothetical protein